LLQSASDKTQITVYIEVTENPCGEETLSINDTSSKAMIYPQDGTTFAIDVGANFTPRFTTDDPRCPIIIYSLWDEDAAVELIHNEISLDSPDSPDSTELRISATTGFTTSFVLRGSTRT